MKTLFTGIFTALAVLISCSSRINNDINIKKAQRHYIDGDFAKAESEALESLKINSDNIDATLLLARIYFLKNRNAEFQKTIINIIQKNQSDISALRLYSLWLIREKRYEEARENLNKILALNEDDLASLYLSGSLCQIEGKTSEAVKYYTAAFKNYVHMKNIHANLSVIYSKLDLSERASDNKKIADAVNAFEESLK